ncbi:sensor histidine kinase [Streptacidiphilus albus]|uniref:sensor histidine kinase n=1 Tax=Streptacidiphilus albus TaxID=105425 RepID=UPI000A6F0694|nr:HAMP domain-containing sensor histidine kinase [Streptacidiphilus albus]
MSAVRPIRLSTRIALVTAAVVPVLVLLSGLLLLGLVSGDLRDRQDALLSERAAAVLPDARTELRAAGNDRSRQVTNQAHRIAAGALDVGVRITGADGSTELAEGPQPSLTAALPTATGDPVTIHADGSSWRALGLQVTATAAQPGGTLWLFQPTSAVEEEVDSVRGRIILVALIAAPLGGLLAFLVAERAARPLRLLQRRTSGLDPDEPATRLEHAPTGVTEVDELAHTLESVLSRYDEQAARTGEALETARAFAASASHELRTPLMSMRTNLDILADHPQLSPEDRAEALADLLSEHARLLGLLTALRSLAQGDLVQADAFAPLDLAELVEAAAADARRRRPRASLELVSTASLPMLAWESGLRMAVDNLITNALVHGAPPGREASIRVTLRRDGDQALLTVDDGGPGVPVAEREAVFGRFRRGPASPGSGLGLTLVAQQIALHRGSVLITDPPYGYGTRVEVRLPLAGHPVRSSTVTLPLRRDWLRAGGGPTGG